MAYVGGPCSYVPGQKIFLPLDTKCDKHPTINAVARIVGEVDSFGFEAKDMCTECYANFEAADKTIEGICDWCESSDTDLVYRRDPEEGNTGRLYQVCEACIKAQNSEMVNQAADEDESNDDDEDVDVLNDTGFDLNETDKPD